MLQRGLLITAQKSWYVLLYTYMFWFEYPFGLPIKCRYSIKKVTFVTFVLIINIRGITDYLNGDAWERKWSQS